MARHVTCKNTSREPDLIRRRCALWSRRQLTKTAPNAEPLARSGLSHQSSLAHDGIDKNLHKLDYPKGILNTINLLKELAAESQKVLSAAKVVVVEKGDHMSTAAGPEFRTAVLEFLHKHTE